MSHHPAPKREVHVAVAVIVRNGRVLIARRPEHAHQGGLLEFPGGKVEPGERVEQALIREIREETGLGVPEGSLQPVIGIRHDYGDKRVFLDVWSTHDATGDAVGREGQPIAWLTPTELKDDDFPAANRPIIRALRLPSLLAISGSVLGPEDGFARLSSALERMTPKTLVLRAPSLTPSQYRQFARQAMPLCQRMGVDLILHGAPAVFAEMPAAAGLHLPWREAAVLTARPVPAESWLGVSCHSAEQLAHAADLGADYATLGPVKITATHPGVDGIGWATFRELVATARIPVYGLGGLEPDDLPRVRAEGGQGVAGIRFWWPQH